LVIASPAIGEGDPEGAIGRPNFGASSTNQRRNLLAKRQVLEQEVAPTADRRADRRQEGPEEAKH
jgi:hypothetical protein